MVDGAILRRAAKSVKYRACDGIHNLPQLYDDLTDVINDVQEDDEDDDDDGTDNADVEYPIVHNRCIAMATRGEGMGEHEVYVNYGKREQDQNLYVNLGHGQNSYVKTGQRRWVKTAGGSARGGFFYTVGGKSLRVSTCKGGDAGKGSKGSESDRVEQKRGRNSTEPRCFRGQPASAVSEHEGTGVF